MRSPWWRTGQHPSHRVSLQREGSTPRRLLTALRVCEKHPVASWMINIDSLCFLQRLHSERQSCSSVCRPQLCLATRHGPQGEERRRDTVVPSLREFPQQWQVIDFINHILRCGGWGRKMGVMMFIRVVLCVTVGSARVRRRSVTSRRRTADQKSSCRLRCHPPPLTPPLEKVGDEEDAHFLIVFFCRLHGFHVLVHRNVKVFPARGPFATSAAQKIVR